MPQYAQVEFEKLTLAIEDECPVGKHFGVSGVGEGLVWVVNYKGSRHHFKTKGQKHSASKVKKVASVDIEKLNSIKEFVEYASTNNRFEQAITEIFGKEPLDVRKMGDLIRWVVKDIMLEEIEAMQENNLEPKEVNKYISTDVKERFFRLQDKQVFDK